MSLYRERNGGMMIMALVVLCNSSSLLDLYHAHTELLPFDRALTALPLLFLFFSASSRSLKKFSTVNGELPFSLIERPTPAAARSTEGGFISTRVNARLEERRRRERRGLADFVTRTRSIAAPPLPFIKRHAAIFTQQFAVQPLFATQRDECVFWRQPIFPQGARGLGSIAPLGLIVNTRERLGGNL